jgi:hypothetical protein
MEPTPLLRPHALGHGLLALAQKNQAHATSDEHVAEQAERECGDHKGLNNLNECSTVKQTNVLCCVAIDPPSSRCTCSSSQPGIMLPVYAATHGFRTKAGDHSQHTEELLIWVIRSAPTTKPVFTET